MLKLMRKGQSTAEYAIVIGLVIAAAVAMQVYVKRGIQAKVKAASDYVDSDSSSVIGNNLGQYDPYYQQSNMEAVHNTNATDATAIGGAVNRTLTNDYSSRTGSTNVTGVSTASSSN